MRLIILHYHLRPGGIRRIIELAAPSLIRQLRRIEKVILATGEPPSEKWLQPFQRSLGEAELELFVEPAFNYLSEQNKSVSEVSSRIRAALTRLLTKGGSDDTLIWAHNLGVGRNLLLSREVMRACAARKLKFISHHHDWWFDNRWHRWPEMRRSGFGTFRGAARAIFPASASARHITINRADARPLQRRFRGRAAWLPNLVERGALPAVHRVRAARAWLLSICESATPDLPFWILPCRLLRRKNIAEALLLTRWLRPEAWLVTTGGPSSADEKPYFDELSLAARRYRWPLRLGVLQGDESAKPSVAELLGASEAVLLTSIQEGFGLPYLEAAAAGRPLIARSLPNVAPDLKEFGFQFPQSYEEIQIDPALFDWSAEQQRQARMYRAWRRRLPRAIRKFAGLPAVISSKGKPRPVPFSRLTLVAQLEVLAQSPADSWSACAPLNPFLGGWRKRAAMGKLKLTPWPRGADGWLSGLAYARGFARIALRPLNGPVAASAGLAAQQEFVRERLRTEHLFPLLWDV